MAKEKKEKWYVVWTGRNPGVYETWGECNNQVYKFRGAQYKSYTSEFQAEQAFKNANYVVWQGRETGVYQDWEACREQIEGFDGARYQSFPTLELAQMVFESGDEEAGKFKEFERGAEKHIRSILSETPTDHKQIPLIVMDPILESISVDAACSGNPGLLEYRGVDTEKNNRLFDLIERAEKWLADNEFENEIHRWDTNRWGEIPADFGRK